MQTTTSPRTSPSERTERGAEDGGRRSFSLSRLSLSITTAGFDEGVCMTARESRGDTHGHDPLRRCAHTEGKGDLFKGTTKW